MYKGPKIGLAPAHFFPLKGPVHTGYLIFSLKKPWEKDLEVLNNAMVRKWCVCSVAVHFRKTIGSYCL